MLAIPARADTLLEQVDFFRVDAYRQLDAGRRAEMGQFFTPPAAARLMASMFAKRPRTLHILDPGAGLGSLSAACVAQACQWERKPQRVTVTAYELEPALADYLTMTLKECEAVCQRAGVDFEYKVIPEDFIAASVASLQAEGGLFSSPHPRFNCAILNPPYHKINNNSRTRHLLRTVGIETGNLYAAFLWLTIKLLESGGELVAITPRSFCNGTYFKPFRLALLRSMAIRRLHVFETRDKAFAADDVLQENIILHAVKSPDRTAKVVISSGAGPDDEDVKFREVPYGQLAHPGDPDAFIHIIADELGHQISRQMRRLDTSLAELGLSISTGRVVDFRARHLLRAQPDNGEIIPLIYPGNFSQTYVTWPSNRVKKPHVLAPLPGIEDLVVPAAYYVLVKRFSAKEEKRRIVAAVYDPGRVSGKRVGFENHLNYYHQRGQGLSLDLAKGLAAFLNSTLVDEYFRQFNGHTQVNATDLRNIKYPDQSRLAAIGARIGDNFPGQDELDRLVKEELNLMSNDPQPYDPIQAKKKMGEALDILSALNLPRLQQNDRSALTLLALLDMKADTPWGEAAAPLRGITEMMDYFKAYFGVTYAPNTRETVRRQTVHQFMQVGLVLANPDEPARPINSPKTRYQVEPGALKLIQTYGTDEWDTRLKSYLDTVETLKRLQAKEREMALIPVKLLDGREMVLSGGGQNRLIKQVLEEFCPRFTPGGVVVYVGDAGDKLKGAELAYLLDLGVKIDRHGKMPDVIIHYTPKNWLVLVEAVTSHGPIELKRRNELQELFSGSAAGLVFVTAFETRRVMMRFLPDIAWETEVWVAEAPSHLIHFNGERFLGPREE